MDVLSSLGQHLKYPIRLGGVMVVDAKTRVDGDDGDDVSDDDDRNATLLLHQATTASCDLGGERLSNESLSKKSLDGSEESEHKNGEVMGATSAWTGDDGSSDGSISKVVWMSRSRTPIGGATTAATSRTTGTIVETSAGMTIGIVPNRMTREVDDPTLSLEDSEEIEVTEATITLHKQKFI
ncbi:hypothetical protein Tco_1034969 [Tanacetum coccineum]